MTDDELTRILHRELAPIRDELSLLRQQGEGLRRAMDAMGPQVAGIPLIHRAIEALRREGRHTASEASALNDDVDKTMTKQDLLEGRIAWIEQQILELREKR